MAHRHRSQLSPSRYRFRTPGRAAPSCGRCRAFRRRRRQPLPALALQGLEPPQAAPADDINLHDDSIKPRRPILVRNIFEPTLRGADDRSRLEACPVSNALGSVESVAGPSQRFSARRVVGPQLPGRTLRPDRPLGIGPRPNLKVPPTAPRQLVNRRRRAPGRIASASALVVDAGGRPIGDPNTDEFGSRGQPPQPIPHKDHSVQSPWGAVCRGEAVTS